MKIVTRYFAPYNQQPTLIGLGASNATNANLTRGTKIESNKQKTANALTADSAVRFEDWARSFFQTKDINFELRNVNDNGICKEQRVAAYDLPCNAENIDKVLFPYNKFLQKQDAIKRQIANRPANIDRSSSNVFLQTQAIVKWCVELMANVYDLLDATNCKYIQLPTEYFTSLPELVVANSITGSVDKVFTFNIGNTRPGPFPLININLNEFLYKELDPFKWYKQPYSDVKEVMIPRHPGYKLQLLSDAYLKRWNEAGINPDSPYKQNYAAKLKEQAAANYPNNPPFASVDGQDFDYYFNPDGNYGLDRWVSEINSIVIKFLFNLTSESFYRKAVIIMTDVQQMDYCQKIAEYFVNKTYLQYISYNIDEWLKNLKIFNDKRPGVIGADSIDAAQQAADIIRSQQFTGGPIWSVATGVVGSTVPVLGTIFSFFSAIGNLFFSTFGGSGQPYCPAPLFKRTFNDPNCDFTKITTKTGFEASVNVAHQAQATAARPREYNIVRVGQKDISRAVQTAQQRSEAQKQAKMQSLKQTLVVAAAGTAVGLLASRLIFGK